jgi:HAD superfamily hydrolase (TIGR01549 family)
MVYKAVLFDMDGTLVHTAPELRYLLVKKIMDELGLECPDHFFIDRFWFEARRDEIIEKYFKVKPEVFWKVYRLHDTAELRVPYTKIYDDINFIKELRIKGYKTAIVTGAPKHIIEIDMNLLGKDNFDVVLRAHSSDGIKPKPDPHGIEHCLKLLNLNKEEVIFVGNSDEDILCGQRAGVFDVLIDRKEHKFPDIKPSMTISSLYELRELLHLN